MKIIPSKGYTIVNKKGVVISSNSELFYNSVKKIYFFNSYDISDKLLAVHDSFIYAYEEDKEFGKITVDSFGHA